ncbi:MAG: hypothetical protein JWQ78_343 [Sediminibacterium sp.]|nr:hypothetical protein [Sediminibacterium sp.]
MKRIVTMNLLIALLISGLAVTANDSIIVKKDPRLDILSAKQSIINKRTSMMTSSGQYKGFRVQVSSTRSREEAFKAKSLLLSSFPDQKTYVMYQSPNFKVRIGNFLKKEDADKFRKQLAFFFPQGVYLVEDAIEYTPPDDEEIIPQ